MAAEFDLHVDAHGRLVVTFHGRLRAATVRQLAAVLQSEMVKLQTNHRRILLLFDARALTLADVPSEVRIAIKEILALPFEGLAVISSSHILRAMSYIIRSSEQASKVKFFRNERQAYRWLDSVGQPHRSRSRLVHLVAGAMVFLIGAFALAGWQNGNQYFTRWLTGLRPMNPLGAVGLLVLGTALCAWGSRWRAWVRAAGALSVALGVAALLPISIDHLLYGAKVAAAGPHTQLADSAAISFIAIGLVLWLYDVQQRWMRWITYALLAGVLGLTQFIVFGSLYAHDFVYGLSGSFVMALNLAVGFAIISVALLVLLLQKQSARLFGSISRTGWLILLALVFMQVASYGSWVQAIDRNKTSASAAFTGRAGDVQDAVNQRLQAYVDSLYGFKGLFAASDYVEQGEFQSYYNSLDLTQNYPGIRALSLITKVTDAQLPAFVAVHRADKSLHPGGNPTFAITSKTTLPIHYILTYNASTNTVGGADLGATPGRLQAFRKADATDAPVSSGTLQFGGTNGQPAQPGFFITIPVSNKVSGKTPIGFVNAVFNYKDFFASAFAHTNLQDGVSIKVTDTDDNDVIFNSRHGGAQPLKYVNSVDIAVADRTWNLTTAAPADFGLSVSQTHLPSGTLFGGQLFAALIAVIFVLQNRSRRAAYALAESMTEDLERERSQAVANDQKSTAILSSIGDAVFALNAKGQITLFNPAAQVISGFSEDEALHRPYHEILHFEQGTSGNPSDHFIRRALEGHPSAMASNTVLVTKSGKQIQVADSAAPIHDARGKLQGAIVVFRDVSKEYELDKAKTEFVSLASHQLRTPLAAINWYGEMLLSGDAGRLTKAQHEYLQEIQDGNRRMVDLVNALLDVSRLDLGKLTNEPPQQVDVVDLVNSLEKELSVTIHQKHIQFTKKVAAKLPLAVADPKLLRMIIQNLLSNAVKYTPANGSVAVTLRRATAQDIEGAHLHNGHAYWFLSVQDSGYGIPKEQQNRIFAKLFRADNVQRMNVEGTGLGLYIVKEVTEKLGGRVWFESVESAGSTFYVVIPFRAKHIASSPGSGVQ